MNSVKVVSETPEACVASNSQQGGEDFLELLKYLVAGGLFGIVFVKAEIISWFRIQEMFRLDSFHMYGVIGRAIVVEIISIQLIKHLHIKTLTGEEVVLKPKEFNRGQIYGGLIFGLGWALTGACPGPLFAQNRKWFSGGGCYVVKCHCWHVDIRLFLRKITSLILKTGDDKLAIRYFCFLSQHPTSDIQHLIVM